MWINPLLAMATKVDEDTNVNWQGGCGTVFDFHVILRVVSSSCILHPFSGLALPVFAQTEAIRSEPGSSRIVMMIAKPLTSCYNLRSGESNQSSAVSN